MTTFDPWWVVAVVTHTTLAGATRSHLCRRGDETSAGQWRCVGGTGGQWPWSVTLAPSGAGTAGSSGQVRPTVGAHGDGEGQGHQTSLVDPGGLAEADRQDSERTVRCFWKFSWRLVLFCVRP